MSRNDAVPMNCAACLVEVSHSCFLGTQTNYHLALKGSPRQLKRYFRDRTVKPLQSVSDNEENLQIDRQPPMGKRGLSSGSMVNNRPASAGELGDVGLIAGSRRSPGGGDGNPLKYSCLENPMDRGAWRAAVHGERGS